MDNEAADNLVETLGTLRLEAVETLRGTNHWLGEIADVLDRMQQYMDRIDTHLERMNDRLDTIIQEL